MVSLHDEIQKRLPLNKKIFRDITLFAPEQILSRESTFSSLPFPTFCVNVDEAEEQFRKLKQVNWREDPGTMRFLQIQSPSGQEVGNYQIGGENIFPDIARYALNCLSLPTSNAYVERVFSIVNFVKDKHSNRMLTPMLDSLILIKTHLQADICKIRIILIKIIIIIS